MPFQVGERVGDYQVIEILGAGGMGQVYKVRNVISDRVEAMKVLLPNLESDPELADRFMREIKVQASLDHPNIAALHTAQRVGNQLVMVMEYVEGQTIEALMRNGPIPLPQAINYVQQVLSALAFAHARGIIHRDIKPPNMMLTNNGVVKLMDFGIAKLTADPKLTQTGRTVGSLYYMSPEQINGVAIDGRSDIYSLGVSLYEMVTGKRPFQGDSDYSIMSAHLLAKPVPPIQLDPRVPDALNEIIMMSIAKDSAQRFQTADAFRSALGAVAAGLGVAPAMAAGAAGAGAQLPPPIPQHAPTAPMTAAAPQPAPYQASAPPLSGMEGAAPPAKRGRGLYMALGSLATVAVIVLAAIEGPKFFKPSGAQTLQQSPAPSVSSTPAPVPTATPEAAPPVSAPASDATAPSTTSAGTPQPVAARPSAMSSEHKPSPGAVSSSPVQRPVQQPVQQPSNVAAQVPATPQQTTPPAAAPPSSAAADEARANAVSELREQLMLLSTRANASKQTIRNMQDQQARSGLGMRQDIVAAVERMDSYMNETEASLRAGDPVKGKKYLASAEREVDKIEKFLGR